MRTKISHFTVIMTPEPEGGFTVTVPSLPGCVTYGRTLVEAKRMAEDAVGGYFASLKKHKEPFPVFSDSFVTTIDIPVRV